MELYIPSGESFEGPEIGTNAPDAEKNTIPLPRRGKVLGLNDMTTGAASIIIPLIGSAVLGVLGYYAFGLIGLAFSLPVMLILFVRETAPGKYEV